MNEVGHRPTCLERQADVAVDVSVESCSFLGHQHLPFRVDFQNRVRADLDFEGVGMVEGNFESHL